MFGGSFDPIHHAHLIVARLAIEQLQLDQVQFTVAASQPFKQGRHVAAATDRLRMVELAVAGIPDFTADGRELLRPAPSYTVDTLRELRAEQPDAQLILLMGADVARGFSEWRDPDQVRMLATIAVCHRPAGTPPPGPRDPFDADVRVPHLDISSTDIRARAARGLTLAGWVPPAVADYIVASRIYRSSAG